MPISQLLPADSPRLAGEDFHHARLLADSDAVLPPILVHRPSMRVIDGMHRLRAAVLRGEDKIRVRYFDGSLDAAFVLAVEANITHGLPLSLADREAAALRIIASHAEWSDRAIARVTGLAGKTVGAIRRRTADGAQLTSRLGSDGRLRPVNGVDGRRRAVEIFTIRPDASLREIARVAGISPGTARDVRERLRRGEDPIPPGQRASERRRRASVDRSAASRHASRRPDLRDRASTLRNLRRDPSLRFTESGRALLQWLEAHAAGPDGWSSVVATIPPHCTYVIADLARGYADDWLEFAEQLRLRAEATA